MLYTKLFRKRLIICVANIISSQFKGIGAFIDVLRDNKDIFVLTDNYYHKNVFLYEKNNNNNAVSYNCS